MDPSEFILWRECFMAALNGTAGHDMSDSTAVWNASNIADQALMRVKSVWAGVTQPPPTPVPRPRPTSSPGPGSTRSSGP